MSGTGQGRGRICPKMIRNVVWGRARWSEESRRVEGYTNVQAFKNIFAPRKPVDPSFSLTKLVGSLVQTKFQSLSFLMEYGDLTVVTNVFELLVIRRKGS